MKTNFFRQIAELGFNGNFLLNIHQSDAGLQTVSVVVKADKAVDGLPPMLFKATAEELDEGFFVQLNTPVKQTAGLISNLATYQKELEKVKKNSKPDKLKQSIKPAEQDEDDSEEDTNLFTPPEDDKNAKAEKKRLYDEAMDRVKNLAQQTKYAEALAQLPDVTEYPDKAAPIDAKRQTLELAKAQYDKLTAQFND